MSFSIRPFRRFPVHCSVTYETDLFQRQGTVARRIHAPATHPPTATAVIRPTPPSLSWSPALPYFRGVAVPVSMSFPIAPRT
jgi:hypothetical protein